MNRRTYLAKGVYTDKNPRELLNVFIRSYHTHKYYAVAGTNVVYKTEKHCDGLVLLDKQVNIASWKVTNIINDVVDFDWEAMPELSELPDEAMTVYPQKDINDHSNE